MRRAPLSATSIRSGAKRQEIVEIAIDNIGIGWTLDGRTDFVWDRQCYQRWLVTVFARTSADALEAALRPSDIVRVYKAGNLDEDSVLPGDGYGAHSFVIVSVSDPSVEVVDKRNTAEIIRHSIDNIMSAFAPAGEYGAAFVSRLDEGYAAQNFGGDLGGNGLGNFSGFADPCSDMDDDARFGYLLHQFTSQHISTTQLDCSVKVREHDFIGIRRGQRQIIF